MIRIPASIIAEMEESWQGLKITWCLVLGTSMKKAARRRLEREEYEMEHADDAWDDWLGGEPIEYEAEADVSASVPNLR